MARYVVSIDMHPILSKDIIVEAESPSAAKALVEQGKWDDADILFEELTEKGSEWTVEAVEVYRG